MWQQAIITILFGAAALYVVWSLMGSRLRLRLLDAMLRSGVAAGWAGRQRAKMMAATGCSGCSVGHGAHPRIAADKDSVPHKG
jgi:hypothetical protein